MKWHSMLQPGIGSHCTKGKENKETTGVGEKKTYGASDLYKM